MKEENFPRTRKPLRGRRQGVGGGKIRSHGGKRSNSGAKDKAERFPHRVLVPTSTHQPETLVCSTLVVGGGRELRLRLRCSDPGERTGVGCMNTA